MKLLLDHGADIETKDFHGRTALSFAAESGGEAVVRLLVENSANIESKDNTGRTPLFCAAQTVEVDTRAAIEVLLNKGAEVNSPSYAGETPLMLTAKHDLAETMQLLLERGADPEAKNNTGRTAWDHMSEYSFLRREILDDENHPFRIIYRQPAPEAPEQQPPASP